ncbi:MAG: roadblock/LC7 domain-containing protein [Planctomycetes bacterium]|nr:roadblock/LC7 domain-containing protein [Planctomycetota bacterium]
MVFYKDDIDKINTVLKEFLSLSDSKCNMLIDKEGHMVTKAGHTEDFDMQAVAALVAGSYAATREMARLLGEEEFSVLFHQGKKDNIQLTLIGDRTILATVFDERTTIGMVRLYAKEASEKLTKIFAEIGTRRVDGENLLGSEFSESARNQLDSFFAE